MQQVIGGQVGMGVYLSPIKSDKVRPKEVAGKIGEAVPQIGNHELVVIRALVDVCVAHNAWCAVVGDRLIEEMRDGLAGRCLVDLDEVIFALADSLHGMVERGWLEFVDINPINMWGFRRLNKWLTVKAVCPSEKLLATLSSSTEHEPVSAG